MEEDIRLVVLEHLRDQLDVHILYIDLLGTVVRCCRRKSFDSNAHLETLVEHHHSLIQLFLWVEVRRRSSLVVQRSDYTYDIRDDTRKQLALLMLVRAFLQACQRAAQRSRWICTAYHDATVDVVPFKIPQRVPERL